MSLSKPTRTGLLLLLVAGPLLVFFFLYLFGENHFEISRYPLRLQDIAQGNVGRISNGLLVLPADASIGPVLGKEYKNQIRRFDTFLSGLKGRPEIKNWGDAIFPNQIGLRLQFTDTILKISTYHEKGLKRLPASPRAFLFDSTSQLRGVYNITDPLSVDTLILEYKILTNQ